MERFRSMKLLGEKKKAADIPTANESGVPTGSNEALSSSSISAVSDQVKGPEGGLRASIRKRFVAKKSSNKTQSPEPIVEDNVPVQANPVTDGMEPHPQLESLFTQRQNFDLPDDPNYQRKLDAIDYSIQIVDHFNELAGVIGLVTPDALGSALNIITKILEKLKKMVENKKAWRELLSDIDDHQTSFNKQLEGVQAQDLSQQLRDPIKKYAGALSNLAADVLNQAGLAKKGAPADSLFKPIKEFITRFLNSDSDAENINNYKAQFAAAMRDFQFRITMYGMLTLNRIDGTTDYLKASIFLEGGGSIGDRTTLVNRHKDCLAGTRVDVLQEIRDWSQTDDGNTKPLYCIHDVAGSGKSTIAYTMAKEWALGGCFVFFFSDYSKDPRALCNSLAKQIIGSCHGDGWAAHWGSISSDVSSPMTNLERLWNKLVAEPLGKCTVHERHFLVVDALDECDKADRGPLLERLLHTCSSRSRPQLRILLTTRVQDDLRHILEQERYRDTVLYRSLRDLKSSTSDITQYVQHRLDKIESVEITATHRDQLVRRCGGLFIFASMACDQLEKMCAEDQPAELEDMLQEFTSLDRLYHLALSQAEDSSLRSRERLKNILRIILVAQEAPSITTIAALLSMRTTSVDTFVKRLGSIISSGAVDQSVYILHATLAEFLLRPHWIEEKKDPQSGLKEEKKWENNYYITKADGHRIALKGCLSDVMSKELQFNICRLETSCLLNDQVKDMDDRIKRYISPGLRYSCSQWANHLESTAFQAEIFDYVRCFMENHFLFWLEVLSVTKRVGLASSMLALLIDWIKDNHQDDEMARDMQKFITAFTVVMSQSAPHIYLSALAFAPRTSPVSKCYMKKYPQTLSIHSGGFSDWPHNQRVLFGHTGYVYSVAFSPDGMRIVSGSEDKTVRVWDAKTGEAVGKPFEGYRFAVTSVAFSPDGKHVVSGSRDNTVRVWDVETGEAVGKPFEGHTHFVNSVAFSPDGKRIVSGSYDETVRMWDAETGEAVGKPFEGHTHFVNSVAFSPDGKRIISGSKDHTVRMWDFETGEAVGKPFEGHTDDVTSVAFSPDGKRIVSGSQDRTVCVWDTWTGEVVGKPFEGDTADVNSVAFSPDGKRIVSGSWDRTVRVWDVETGEAVGKPFEGHTSSVTSVAFSPDGKRIISGSIDNTVRMWDAETEEAVEKPFKGYINYVNSVAFSPDGKRIISGSSDNTVRMWDFETGEAVGKPFKGHTDYVTSVAFSPDGKRIISGSGDKTVRMWDFETGEAVGKPFEGHTVDVYSVAFSPDGKRIISGSGDKAVRMWDFETGEAVGKPFEGHTSSVTSVAFSPDGKRIVSGSNDWTVRVWDVETGEAVGKPFKRHTGYVYSVAFSPNGKRIVSGSWDQAIRVWDVETGEAVGKPFKGHTEIVSSVAFSPDGKRIVSGSWDKTARVWDAETGKAVGKPFEGHTDRVNSVAFSPNGKCIVSASSDDTIRFWSLEKDTLSKSLLPNAEMVDGWVLDSRSERLFWVPPQLRAGLSVGGATMIIGRFIKTTLNLESFVCGESWGQCKRE